MNFKMYSIFAIVFFAFNSFAGFLPVANISKIEGHILVNNKNAKVGDEISEGSIIEAKSKKDLVDIKYQNGHVIRLRFGKLMVTKLDPKNSLLELSKGVLFNLVNKLTPGETFKVKTTYASFAVRGTRFYIDQSSKKESYLCVCEGAVVATRGKDEAMVEKDHDLHLDAKKKLTITDASQMMKNMGNTVFSELEK